MDKQLNISTNIKRAKEFQEALYEIRNQKVKTALLRTIEDKVNEVCSILNSKESVRYSVSTSTIDDKNCENLIKGRVSFLFTYFNKVGNALVRKKRKFALLQRLNLDSIHIIKLCRLPKAYLKGSL